jgi:hypothetical protein
MAAERCRVCVHLNGATQFYQRDQEQRRDGRWIAVPYFVLNPREAITMSEAQGRVLIDKIRGLGFRGEAWIEDARDGRRIDVLLETPQSSGEDNRVPVIATLDDENEPTARWYVVRPTCTPNGRLWFLSMYVPGLPERTTIYAADPLGVLQRAHDMNYLQFAEKYQRPEPQQQQAVPIQNSGFRRRPGELR